MYTKFLPTNNSEIDILYYEIQMLNESLKSMNQANQTDINCHLESFLIHARNLIDFLEDNKIHKDDLTCSNFKNSLGGKIVKINVKLPTDAKIKINKHLSHITTTRLNEKLGWDTNLIRSEINNGLTAFFDQISPTYFSTPGGKTENDFRKLIV